MAGISQVTYVRDSSKDISILEPTTPQEPVTPPEESTQKYISKISDGTNTYIIKDAEARASIPTIATSVSESSTNAEAVGAKLFYDTCGDIESLLAIINSGNSGSGDSGSGGGSSATVTLTITYANVMAEGTKPNTTTINGTTVNVPSTMEVPLGQPCTITITGPQGSSLPLVITVNGEEVAYGYNSLSHTFTPTTDTTIGVELSTAKE